MQKEQAAAGLLLPARKRAGGHLASFDEDRFQTYLHKRNLPVTRTGLGFAVILISVIVTVDYLTTDYAHASRVVPLRLGLMLLPMLVALILTFVSAWRPYIGLTVAAAGFLCGIGTFSNSFVAALMHEPVVLWGNIFFTFYIYLLLGLSFRESIIAASPILVISIAFGIALDTPVHKIAYVVFSQLIGMYTSYRLEQDAREIYDSLLRLEETSRTDGLTGVYNRGMFDDFLPRAWRQAAREGQSIGLLLVDVDHFKAYNDSLGHQAGDECLSRVAAALDQSVKRPLDFVARYGGEEFVIVLYATKADYLERFAATLRAELKALNLPHPASPTADRVTISIGAGVFYPGDGHDAEEAISRVDSALYDAKSRGRDTAVIVVSEPAAETRRVAAGCRG